MKRTIGRLLILSQLIVGGLSLSAAEDKPNPAKPRSFVFKTVGDLKIKADVYAPEGARGRPVIAWFHGGALMMGSRTGVPKQLIDLSRKENFVLVSFDYRLVPQVKLQEIVKDLEDAMTWLRAKGPNLFGADPKRIAVAGASAGGYLALMSGVVCDPPPTAIVAYWGFGDVDGDWTTKPNANYGKPISKEDAWAGVSDKPMTGTNKQTGGPQAKLFTYFKQTGLWARTATGLDPEKDREKLKAFGPVYHVTADYPPTLMLHGTQDKDVPHSQAVAMAAAFKRAGVEHELFSVEGGGHSLWGGDPGRIQAAFARSMEYLKESLTK
jgi:acetyl esterase/lipase